MSDAIERLKNKTRPIVPKRDKSLIKDENTKLQSDAMTEFSHSKATDRRNETNDEVIEDAITHPHQERQAVLPQTIRRTIRLDEEIDNQLEELCYDQKITRETFIEAAFLICTENEKLMQQVMKEAKQRYQTRKKLGEKRKFYTIAQKFKDL